MFFFFRIMNIGISGCFVFLSFTPVFICLFLCSFLCLFINMFWSFLFFFFLFKCLFFLLLFFLKCYMWDLFIDFLRCLFDFSCLIRCLQYCFIWFVLSEIFLFCTLFGSIFGYCLFVCCEFYFLTPYYFKCIDFGCVFYWFYIDCLNIYINTFFLLVSGLLFNCFIFFVYIRFFVIAIFFFCLGIFLGVLFIFNQLWEFTFLHITLSCSIFGTLLFCIDMLHFSHVLIGLILFFFVFSKFFFMICWDSRFIFMLSACLYWHFVDIIWFFLLRFVYLDICCF